MASKEMVERWNKEAKKLVGKKIVECAYFPFGESDSNTHCLAIVLDDGTQLVPQSDDEFNDFGALSVSTSDGVSLYCLP